MNSITTIILCTSMAVLTSCVSRPGPAASTGSITPAQAAAARRISNSTSKALTKQGSITAWRTAVETHTRSLVASGQTDIDQVKRLVCEQTAAEEAAARQDQLAWVDLMRNLATPNTDPGAAALLKDAAPSTEATLRDVYEKSFSRTRDALIEKIFKESTAKPGQATPAAGSPVAAPQK